jgi:hypothetical protein
MRRAGLALLAALAVAGCGGGSDHKSSASATSTMTTKERTAPREAPASPGKAPSDAAAIRDWIRSLNAGEYDRAASYFARNAIVEQVSEMRLPNHQAAVDFLRGLPCRADVTTIKDEGTTSLASFKLRRGPGGACKGSARVRFRIKHGKFTEWRQLAEPAAPPGTSA